MVVYSVDHLVSQALAISILVQSQGVWKGVGWVKFFHIKLIKPRLDGPCFTQLAQVMLELKRAFPKQSHTELFTGNKGPRPVRPQLGWCSQAGNIHLSSAKLLLGLKLTPSYHKCCVHIHLPYRISRASYSYHNWICLFRSQVGWAFRSTVDEFLLMSMWLQQQWWLWSSSNFLREIFILCVSVPPEVKTSTIPLQAGKNFATLQSPSFHAGLTYITGAPPWERLSFGGSQCSRLGSVHLGYIQLGPFALYLASVGYQSLK